MIVTIQESYVTGHSFSTAKADFCLNAASYIFKYLRNTFFITRLFARLNSSCCNSVLLSTGIHWFISYIRQRTLRRKNFCIIPRKIIKNHDRGLFASKFVKAIHFLPF